MNISELRMMWMNQYNPNQLSLEDSSSYFSHPSIGLSVMEDISQKENAMDMNRMISVNGQETTAVVTSATLCLQPTATLLAPPSANELYGISTIGGFHRILQQSSAFNGFTEIIEKDEIIDHSGTHYVNQIFDAIDESRDDEEIAGPTSKQEIINIDDFVMMTDSNSYDDTERIIGVEDIKNKTIEKGAIVKLKNQRKSRKIEPVSRPGLVLKTPIAYNGNIDPSVIPIQKDGMAVCERCGAIGVKHTFYTKTRRFCSMACARGELFSFVCNKMIRSTDANTMPTTEFFSRENLPNSIIQHRDIELSIRVPHIQSLKSNYRLKITNQSLVNLNGNDVIKIPNETVKRVAIDEIPNQKQCMYGNDGPCNDLPQTCKFERLPSPCPQNEKICSVRRKPGDMLQLYDWTQKLSVMDFHVAPVTCFPHAPGFNVWNNIGIHMKVEVENTDCHSQELIQPGQTPHSFWVATILKIRGYKALMRYEGFEETSHDFWVNLCSSEVHSVGWCATRGKPLIPPRTIESKYSDWKDFLVERLSGARTLPSSFYSKINDSMCSRFRLGLNLECVDKDNISQVKLATVNKIVGKRLFVKYFDSDDGFWCHEDSPIIHPVGWATTVGHNLAAPQDYLERMLAGREQMIEVHNDDATIELFKMNFTFEEYYINETKNGFLEGMKLEAVDPLNLSSICAATVMAVLKFGYMMIRIDSYQSDATGSDWFCYHEKSPNIFPVGFCATHKICLTPPKGHDSKSFSWVTYLKETQSMAAGEHLFNRIIPNHGFEVGMSLECADLMDPRLVCVATVARVVGRLLKIHFDGWTDEYDQWLDCESPDVYPVGWCVLVNHKLEGPPMHSKLTFKMAIKSKHKKRRKRIIKPENSFGDKHLNRPINIKREAQDSLYRNKSFSTEHLGIKLEMKSEPLCYGDEVDEEVFEVDQLRHSNKSAHLPITSELIVKSTISTADNVMSLNINPNSISSDPPIERNTTSYIGNSSASKSKYIPRLTDVAQDPVYVQTSVELMPETWNVYDVSQFLRLNDCMAHCDVFKRNEIDGRLLLSLSKDEIITLLGMKVGPALKIFDLIQQLKCRLNPSKSRLLRGNKLFL